MVELERFPAPHNPWTAKLLIMFLLVQNYTPSVMSATGGGDYKAAYGPCRPQGADPRDQRHQSPE